MQKLLDIKLIREHPEVVRNDLEKRGAAEKLRMLDDLIVYDKEWRQRLAQVNELRRKRNVITAEIAKLKKKGVDATAKLKEAEGIRAEIKQLEIMASELNG